MNILKEFPSKYLKAVDLDGRAVTVTIRDVTKEQVGQPPEDKVVVWFMGTERGLVLNKTNGLKIAELHGPETSGWKGKKLTLYPTEVEAFGSRQEAIRVRGPKIEQTPAPEPTAAENGNPFEGEDVPELEF